MIRTSPFHKRTSALNETGLWEHWSGTLAANRYQMSDKFEYFAVRNAAGVFDSSPRYKYRITGRDAEHFLSGVLAREHPDVRTGKRPIHGVVRRPRLRHRGRRDLRRDRRNSCSTAEPNLAWFDDLIGRDRVAIEEVSDEIGARPVQALLARPAQQARAGRGDHPVLRPRRGHHRRSARDDLADRL